MENNDAEYVSRKYLKGIKYHVGNQEAKQIMSAAYPEAGFQEVMERTQNTVDQLHATKSSQKTAFLCFTHQSNCMKFSQIYTGSRPAIRTPYCGI